jgi:hypothetical protein
MLYNHKIAFCSLQWKMPMEHGVNPDKNCHSIAAEVDNLRLGSNDKPIRV